MSSSKQETITANQYKVFFYEESGSKISYCYVNAKDIHQLREIMQLMADGLYNIYGSLQICHKVCLEGIETEGKIFEKKNYNLISEIPGQTSWKVKRLIETLDQNELNNGIEHSQESDSNRFSLKK